MQSRSDAVIAMAYLVAQRKRYIRIVHRVDEGAVVQLENGKNHAQQDGSGHYKDQQKRYTIDRRSMRLQGAGRLFLRQDFDPEFGHCIHPDSSSLKRRIAFRLKSAISRVDNRLAASQR